MRGKEGSVGGCTVAVKGIVGGDEWGHGELGNGGWK